MRTTVWRAALLAGVLAQLASRGGADVPRSVDLVLVWTDPGRALSSEAAGCVRREVSEQLRAWGVRVLWRPDGIEPTSTLRVVVLNRSTMGIVGSHVLGTASSPRDVASTAWVLLPNVTALLERRTANGPPPTAALARALARVTLHEVIHLLAPHLGHARTGLMRARLQPADLVGPFIALDARSREALLGRIAGREPGAAVALGL